MSEENVSTELFNQYAVEVGRYLPRRKRKDIQLEILSLLEDSLEDRSEEAGQRPDEAMAIEVLKSLGPPINFAKNFQESNVLLGPAVYPFFRYMLSVVAVFYILQFLLGLALPLGRSGLDILDTIDTFLDNGFRLFGMIVLSFALIERILPASWLAWPFKEMERTWEPSSLKQDKKKQAVKPRELWFEVIILAGAIVLFAGFPQWVGVGNNLNGDWDFIPMLSEEFLRYLPWLLAYFLAKIIFIVSLSRQSFWDQRMRWIEIGIKSTGTILLLALLTGPNLLGLNPNYLAFHNPSAEIVDWFAGTLPNWNTALRIFLFFITLIQVIQLAWMVIKAVRQYEGNQLAKTI